MIEPPVPSALGFIVAANALAQDLANLLSSPIVALTFIFFVGAFGLYMLLPGQQQFSTSAVKWFGGPLMLISLALLSALVGVRVGWWPQIPRDEQVSLVAFCIPAVLSLACAVLAITSRRMTSSLLWFAAMGVSICVLLLLHGAYLPAAANAVLVAAALVAWRVALVPADRGLGQSDGSRQHPAGEPFLACATGGLLCVVLVGIITSATGGSRVSEDDRLGRTMARKREALAESTSHEDNRDSIAARALSGRGLGLTRIFHRPVTALAAGALVLASLAAAIGVGMRPTQGHRDDWPVADAVDANRAAARSGTAN
jgi:NADH:ubiquinone oxidoreductase subunit 6 (subunit J)